MASVAELLGIAPKPSPKPKLPLTKQQQEQEADYIEAILKSMERLASKRRYTPEPQYTYWDIRDLRDLMMSAVNPDEDYAAKEATIGHTPLVQGFSGMRKIIAMAILNHERRRPYGYEFPVMQMPWWTDMARHASNEIRNKRRKAKERRKHRAA